MLFNTSVLPVRQQIVTHYNLFRIQGLLSFVIFASRVFLLFLELDLSFHWRNPFPEQISFRRRLVLKAYHAKIKLPSFLCPVYHRWTLCTPVLPHPRYHILNQVDTRLWNVWFLSCFHLENQQTWWSKYRRTVADSLSPFHLCPVSNQLQTCRYLVA